MFHMGDIAVNAGVQPRPWYQNVLDSLSQAATVYLTIEQQRELMRINSQRLAQGLPAIDPSQYAAGVNVGVTSDTRNTLLLALGIAGGVYLLGKVLK